MFHFLKSDMKTHSALVECQISKVNKVKLLSERTSGVRPVIFMIRFWKKFVHRDGSYDAGGVQGRYVYSTWPAVGMLMRMRMGMMELVMKMRGMVMLKTMHT